MGAQHSTQSTTAYCEGSTPKDDSFTNSSAFETGGDSGAAIDTDTPPLTPQNPIAPIVPRRPAPPMPQWRGPESFQDKLYRKFKAEPLIPIGCLTTAYFLGSGIKSFYNRDPVKSQTMMRLRVGSQFATILIFMGYAGWNAFSFELAPGMAAHEQPGQPLAGMGKSGGGEGEKQ
mmetsp:Transcript_31686/g.66632  ORF Transcript_31686/g.66632 Transcript_31686/m.66632 type:complete len:174 (-) Transcript_31686:402-923(-)|eukprot:CAMPEP_0172301242 /NCGR_PEP_ID=MMETSP1058-20130122/3176_1 /TAXON_ID=83371 /ORGANISM="Detonula confervacea, Strain CCMP 353" /LENGTH=173 /DNA_ID=CAMNT_0013011291 /DNA_START=69 /DNA_END=590 /DNA_ORIENTATION=+